MDLIFILAISPDLDICQYWQCNRPCLKNSLGVEVNSHLCPYIILGVLSHALIFYFIIWLLEGSLESYQTWLTIFSSTWCHIKDRPGFFTARCICIGTKWWCTWKIASEIDLVPWYIVRGLLHFFSWKWDTGLVPWLHTPSLLPLLYRHFFIRQYF